MSEENEPHPQAPSDRPSTSRERPTELSRTARIKAISGALTHAGKAYKIIELEDGEKLRAFDSKQAEGLTPGMEVDYTLIKSARTGYWDLKRIYPAGAEPEEPIQSGEPSTEPEPVIDQGEAGRLIDEKEWGMRSMNSLTNATTLLAALIQKDIVKPTGVEQACALVGDLHRILLKLHDQAKPGPEV